MNKEELIQLIKNNDNKILDVINQLNIVKEKGEGDDLVELFAEIGLEIRCCNACDNLMVAGYCMNEGLYYACNDECLEPYISVEEFRKNYTDDGDSYYTDWLEFDKNGQPYGIDLEKILLS